MKLKDCRVLVTATSYAMDDPTLRTDLEEAVGEVIYNTTKHPLTASELVPMIKGIDGMIAGLDEIDAQVIEALVSALSSPQVVGDPLVLGKLYRWYADKFQAEVSLFELGRLAGSLAKSKKVPVMRKFDLPAVNTAVATEAAALLVHPATSKYGQWVYEAEDSTYAEIHRFIQENGL